jgi:hypothetical protein
LATASDSSIRDGARAVGFAQEAVQLSGGREPRFLRTLAAAYAESGRFSEAIAVAQQAAVIATMQAKPDMAKAPRERSCALSRKSAASGKPSRQLIHDRCGHYRKAAASPKKNGNSSPQRKNITPYGNAQVI